MHASMNVYGMLRRCTEQRRVVVDVFLFLAAALVVVRQISQRARLHSRCPGRPTARRQ